MYDLENSHFAIMSDDFSGFTFSDIEKRKTSKVQLLRQNPVAEVTVIAVYVTRAQNISFADKHSPYLRGEIVFFLTPFLVLFFKSCVFNLACDWKFGG